MLEAVRTVKGSNKLNWKFSIRTKHTAQVINLSRDWGRTFSLSSHFTVLIIVIY